MGTDILDAAGLGDAGREETAATAESIEDADGFAQVFPEHKFHIVDVLQKRGHIVGMTGDGVNDAPALKKADCGIAVSGATDAARAAASIVLMKPGLSVIIDAIKESRRIVQRMNSYAIYRIAETLRVLVFVTLAILIFNFFPVTAVMIVVLALLNDGSILSIAYDNVHYKNQPETWNMRLVIGMATVLGLVGPIAAFGLFYLGDRGIPPRPCPSPDADVPDAVGGRVDDDLPDPHPRPVLVHPPGTDPGAGRARRGSDRDAAGGLRDLDDTPRLALGPGRVGLRARLVPDDRPGQARRLPDPRPRERPGHRARRPACGRAQSGPRPAGEAAATAKPTPFHTDTDPGDLVFHDSSDRPYGQEIRRDGNDEPGTDGRRR